MSAIVENVCERDAVAITPPAEREESLAVIVPVYNEERTVAEPLRRLEVKMCVAGKSIEWSIAVRKGLIFL